MSKFLRLRSVPDTANPACRKAPELEEEDDDRTLAVDALHGSNAPDLDRSASPARQAAPIEHAACPGGDFGREGGGHITLDASRVSVKRKPIIGIISIGSEPDVPEEVPAYGGTRDISICLCGAYVWEQGGIPRYFGIIRDNPERLKDILEIAIRECDAILISGGSSRDERDTTATVIGTLREMLAHGIAPAPRKPMIIGIPGHPASKSVVLTVLVSHRMRVSKRKRRTKSAPPGKNLPPGMELEEYVRVRPPGNETILLFGKTGLLHLLIQGNEPVRIHPGCGSTDTYTEVEAVMW